MTEPIAKIDVHAHNGEWGYGDRFKTPEAFQRPLARYNIRRCFLSSTRAASYDMVSGNVETFAFAEAAERCMAYVYIDPWQPDVAVAEMAKYADHPMCVGVKSRPSFHGRSLADPACSDLCREIARRNWPLLQHTWGLADARDVAAVSDKYGIRIIAAHCGGQPWRECLPILAAAPLVYFDPVSSYTDRGKVAACADACGIDRLLFGTDYSLFDVAIGIGCIEAAGFNDEELKKVFHDNAAKLFGLA